MIKPVWQRESVWLGAEGVEAKCRHNRHNRHHAVPAKTLDKLLSRPEWRGATVLTDSEFAHVRHPSGAYARVRLVPLVEQTCGRRDCKNPYRRCSKCTRRTCHHLINAGVCRQCRPLAITLAGALK